MIEASDPGGVYCTTRKVFAGGRSRRPHASRATSRTPLARSTSDTGTSTTSSFMSTLAGRCLVRFGRGREGIEVGLAREPGTKPRPADNAAWSPSQPMRAPSSITGSAATTQPANAAHRIFKANVVGYGTFVAPEVAEAASRSGDAPLLAAALRWMSERTKVTPYRLGPGHRGPHARPTRSRVSSPIACTASPSNVSAAPVSGSSSPADTCSYGSMAAPRTTPHRCPPATTHRARHVRRGGHRRLRRACPPRAAGDGRNSPKANRRNHRRPHRAGSPRSHGSLETDSPIPRSAHACSSAPARSNGTSRRSSRSSGSAPASSSGSALPPAAGAAVEV